ncbi:MAG: sarcosine oxidase subunit gamma [Acetobacteraceae bacterium]|nr:sarcosine oxidase subunit gamma [Acetobacteraceae bacterium]
MTAGPSGREGGAPGVTITERPFLAAASLTPRAGRREALATRLADRFGLVLPLQPRRSAAGPVSLVWSGPSQWLAFDEARQGMARFMFSHDLAEVTGDAASVTELSGARAVFHLAGPDAQEALTRLVPIDLDPAAFPPGAAALTLAGHVGVMLWRRGDAGESFEICCYRSFARSLAEALVEAARPFGCLVAPAS